MYRIRIIPVLLAIAGITASLSDANASSISTLSPSTPVVTDIGGSRLSSVSEGQQIMIATTFQNNLERDVAFVGIIELRDENGITVFLALQSNTVEAMGNKTVGVSFLVSNASAYQARTFALSSLESPQVLTEVKTRDIYAAQAP